MVKPVPLNSQEAVESGEVPVELIVASDGEHAEASQTHLRVPSPQVKVSRLLRRRFRTTPLPTLTEVAVDAETVLRAQVVPSTSKRVQRAVDSMSVTLGSRLRETKQRFMSATWTRTLRRAPWEASSAARTCL